MTPAFNVSFNSRRWHATGMSSATTRVGRWIGLPLLSRLAARMAACRRRERGIAELQALDDRFLRDLGITRSEIRNLAR